MGRSMPTPQHRRGAAPQRQWRGTYWLGQSRATRPLRCVAWRLLPEHCALPRSHGSLFPGRPGGHVAGVGGGSAGRVSEDANGPTMRKTLAAGLGLASALVWPAEDAGAASFECDGRRRSLTETTICRDAQLSRTDAQLARRLGALSRQLSFGQYLGLRHWHGAWVQDRNRCGADRVCLAAAYRTQTRFLDRLQQCLDTSPRRRTCLRTTLSGDIEARRR